MSSSRNDCVMLRKGMTVTLREGESWVSWKERRIMESGNTEPKSGRRKGNDVCWNRKTGRKKGLCE